MQNKNSLVSVSGTFLRKKFTSLLSTTALVVAGSALPLLSPFSIHSAMANNGNVCNGSSGDVVCFNSGQEQFNDTGQVTHLTVNDGLTITNFPPNPAVAPVFLLDDGFAAIGRINIGAGASVIQNSEESVFDVRLPVNQFTNNGTIRSEGTGLNLSNPGGVASGSIRSANITNNGVIRGSDAAISGDFPTQDSLNLNLTNAFGATLQSDRSTAYIGSDHLDNIINSGEISGSNGGVFTREGNDRIVNTSTGEIVVRFARESNNNAINTGAGSDTVINAGLLRSNNENQTAVADRKTVDLGTGNDIFEIQPGSRIFSDASTSRAGTVDAGTDTSTAAGIQTGKRMYLMQQENDLLRFGGTGNGTFNLDDIDTGKGDRQYQNFESFAVSDGNWSFSGTTTEEFTVDPRASNQLFVLARQAAVVAGPVQRVIPTAILSGNGTFGELTINSGGGLSPGNSIGTTTINEDLQFNPGSTLIIEVSQTGADQVVVGKGGNVRIFGGTLELRDLAPALQDTSQTFIIIDNQGKDQVQTGIMGGGAVGFDEVVDNLAFLTPQVTLTGGDGNDVEVSFEVDAGANGEIFSMLQTSTPNQGNVGRALDGLDNTEGSEGKQLRDSLLVLTEDQARQTFTDLSGDIHSSGTQNFFDVGNQVGDAIGGRFSNLGSFGGGGGSFALSQSFSFGAAWPGTVPAKQHADALDAGDFLEAERKNSIWGSLTGHYSELDGTGNGTGVQSDGFGFVGGVDQKITENTTVGISGGYASSDVSSASGNSDLDIDSLTVALYGLHELDALTFSGFAAYTYHDVDGTRRIPILGLTANSDYSADQFTLQGEVNYRIENAFDAADAIPFINGRYVNVDSDAFTETGAGAANLISSGTSSDAFDLTGGMRFEAVTTTGKAFVGAGYQYRFGDVATDTTFTFAGGGTFTAQGVARDRGSAFVEAGLEMDLKDNLSFFANGAANFGGDFEAYSGSAGLKFEF